MKSPFLDHPQVSRARKIAGDILIALAAAFTVYLSIVMLYRIHSVVRKDTYRAVFRYELVICACFLLMAFDLRCGFLTRFRAKALRITGWFVRCAAGALAAVSLICAAIVIAAGFRQGNSDAPYAVVLGIALENDKPTKDLEYRLETAATFAASHPDSILVVTGGNAADGARTEAEVMKEILTELGIPEQRILVEDKAVDTAQNFANAAKMIDPNAPVVLITSNYHMFRAMQEAKKNSFSDLRPCPASSNAGFYGANVMWEVIGIYDSVLNG